MANTTNFGWETPDDTDLVKDGAAAMRTLGNSIDASFVDLKGGTTNQVLAKNSNTDLDFKWVADATGIPATIFDAKGDLIAATAADTAARLAVGANGTVLTADSAEATGLKWATPSGGGADWTLLNSGGTSLSGSNAVTISGISGKEKIMVFVTNASCGSTNSIGIRINNDSSAVYRHYGNLLNPGSTYNANTFNGYASSGESFHPIARMSTNANSVVDGYALIDGGTKTGGKTIISAGGGSSSTENGQWIANLAGFYGGSAAITSVTVRANDNFDAGTVFVYATA